MYVEVIPETVINEVPFSIFLPSKLSPTRISTRIFLFIYSVPIFFVSFAIEFTNEINPLDGALSRSDTSDEPNILGGLNINPPYCKMLDN